AARTSEALVPVTDAVSLSHEHPDVDRRGVYHVRRHTPLPGVRVRAAYRGYHSARRSAPRWSDHVDTGRPRPFWRDFRHFLPVAIARCGRLGGERTGGLATRRRN